MYIHTTSGCERRFDALDYMTMGVNRQNWMTRMVSRRKYFNLSGLGKICFARIRLSDENLVGVPEVLR